MDPKPHFQRHYDAYRQAKQQEQTLDSLVKILNPDNDASFIDQPYQEPLEQLLYELWPDLYNWYMWWLHEGGIFTANNKPYNTKQLTLHQFLDIIQALPALRD